MCQLVFQNTNRFHEHAKDTKTSNGLKRGNVMQTGILPIAEHQLNMRHPQVATNFARSIKNKVGPSSTYGSICATDKDKRPRELYGGTSTTAANRWNSRMKQVDTDGRMGRWTKVTMQGKDKSRLAIFSVYRIGQKKINLAEVHTSANQQ